MGAALDLAYLLAAALFILGLKDLGHPRTAPRGNLLGASGMFVAVVATIARMQLVTGIEGWLFIAGGVALGTIIGLIMAIRVQMTGMPEMVALFNGFGGGASALVALSENLERIQTANVPAAGSFELWSVWSAIGASALVGWMTLSGSLFAMAKLMGGVTLFGRWFSTPTWGPPWLNVVKALALIGVVALIVLSGLDPTK